MSGVPGDNHHFEVPIVDIEPEDELAPGRDKLDRATRLAHLQVEQEAAVVVATLALAKAKEALRRTREVDLPEALAQAGLRDFTLDTGEGIEIATETFASIPKGKEEEAFDWLVRDGAGELIKHTITLKLPRGSQKLVERIVRSLGKLNDTLPKGSRFGMTSQMQVHPQTLQKFVRDADRAKREDLPDDLLGVFRRRVANVVAASRDSF